MWYHSVPNSCFFIILLQYTGNKFSQSGLQGNKYNTYTEIFKPCNPQLHSLSSNPPKY